MSRAATGAAPPMRRAFLADAGRAGLAALLGANAWSSRAATQIELPFTNGAREVVTNFPQKGPMLLLRTRPPLLETPFEVFDQGVFTPNDRFYVRWHVADIPETIDPADFQLRIRGHVQHTIALSLDDLVHGFETVEIAAVNQCSGNSRGFFSPRVAGGQWGNGAMGNALWQGVRLKDVLDRAGVKAGALQVRFNGLDSGVLPGTPDFIKSLDLDHARDGEVMIAYAMNGKPLPLLNGFPLRLVVPGWYATYWVKMLNDIEVLPTTDDNFWMRKAYLVPDTPFADASPGQPGIRMIPINRMLPRSFFTSVRAGSALTVGHVTSVRGIAFGGDASLSKVLFSPDAGLTWQETQLGQDYGKYSFRQWQVPVNLSSRGSHTFIVRAINTAGSAQPDRANWNGGGFMRNVTESITVLAV